MREYRIINNSVNFIEQKEFENCEYKKKLKFDFYLPDKNICIEYAGIQHFEPIEFFGGEKSFINQKKRDKIKNDYCKSEDIILVRIPYTESNIEELLNEYLI